MSWLRLLVFVLASSLVVSLLPLGCTPTSQTQTVEQIERHRTLLQAAVYLVIATTLREHPAWAPQVVQTTAFVRESVAKQSQVTVSGAFLLVNEHLPLQPEDKALVLPVLIALEGEANMFLRDMGITTQPEVRRLVNDMLTWVELAARPWVPVAKGA